MARSIKRPLCPVVLVALVLAAAAALADVTIVMENETTTPDGKQTTTVTQYYTETKMRNEYGEASAMIIDLDEERMVTLMPATKQYLVQTFKALRDQAAHMRFAKPEVKIEETDEEAEINGFACHKVLVRMKTAGSEYTTEYWMAKDVEGIEDVQAFQKAMYKAYEGIPQQRANMEATKPLFDKGLFPIKTVTKHTMPDGEMVTTMTVKEIKKGDLDEALFEIPDDYEELSFGVPGGDAE